MDFPARAPGSFVSKLYTIDASSTLTFIIRDSPLHGSK